MPSAVGFEFPPDTSGQWDGFNESGMEHFTGSPFEHLGREVPQNTMDARATSPARIRISLLAVPTKSVPGIAELKQVMDLCLSGSAEESDKSQAFFKNATKLLAAKNLNVLQISDYNTTGVIGPCVNGTPFFAMMKATGQSKKSGTAGGSYGIGKLAPFTVSDLRTVFLTTVWEDAEGGQHHYVQGKSILMSHLDSKGTTRRGTGFWGQRKNCMPVETIEAVPDWLRRADADGSLSGKVGTTLSILGFAGKKGWQNALAANIAENFFGALQEGHLEIAIDNGPTVSRDTLQAIFEDGDIRASIDDQKSEPDKFSNVRSYLKAITDEVEVKTEETENLHLGKCRLKLLVGEGLPKKVAVLRNGMLITDELARLKRFSSYKEFVAVLECRSEKGLILLRSMEPPRHDDFEPDRLPPEKRHSGRVALNEITNWVREMLTRHAKDPISEVTSLDEMADYFGDEEEAGAWKKTDENPGGTIIIRQRPIKHKPQPTGKGASEVASNDPTSDDDDDQDEGVGGKPIQKADGTKDAEAGGKGTTGGNAGSSGNGGSVAGRGKRTTATGVALRDVRAVLIGPSRRRVAFTPAITGIVNVEIQDSGADTNHLLTVQGSDLGSVIDGRIEGVYVTAGERVVLEVDFGSEFAGTIRVVANAV